MLKFCWQAMVRSTVGPVKPANKPTLLTIYKVGAPTVPCFIKCSPHHTTLWSQCPTILYNCPTATAQVTVIPVVQAAISHLPEEALHIHHCIRKSFLNFLKILNSTDFVAFSIKWYTFFLAALNTYQLADPPANQQNLSFFFSQNNTYNYIKRTVSPEGRLSFCKLSGSSRLAVRLQRCWSPEMDGISDIFCKHSRWAGLIQGGWSVKAIFLQAIMMG